MSPNGKLILLTAHDRTEICIANVQIVATWWLL